MALRRRVNAAATSCNKGLSKTGQSTATEFFFDTPFSFVEHYAPQLAHAGTAGKLEEPHSHGPAGAAAGWARLLYDVPASCSCSPPRHPPDPEYQSSRRQTEGYGRCRINGERCRVEVGDERPPIIPN